MKIFEETKSWIEKAMNRWKERTGGETLQSKKGRINVPEEERQRITKRDQGWKRPRPEEEVQAHRP